MRFTKAHKFYCLKLQELIDGFYSRIPDLMTYNYCSDIFINAIEKYQSSRRIIEELEKGFREDYDTYFYDVAYSPAQRRDLVIKNHKNASLLKLSHNSTEKTGGWIVSFDDLKIDNENVQDKFILKKYISNCITGDDNVSNQNMWDGMISGRYIPDKRQEALLFIIIKHFIITLSYQNDSQFELIDYIDKMKNESFGSNKVPLKNSQVRYRKLLVKPKSAFALCLLNFSARTNRKDIIFEIDGMISSCYHMWSYISNILVNYDLLFGGFSRLKICGHCGKIRYQQREGSPGFCSNTCAKKSYYFSKLERNKCKNRQNRWIKYWHRRYDFKGKPGTVWNEHCDKCHDYINYGNYPESGFCSALVENNKQFFEYKKKNKPPNRILIRGIRQSSDLK